MKISKSWFMFINLAIRLAIVYVATIIDKQSEGFKYTDVDYHVFSDAATKVWNGGSPFERHTYRYTPLVAYICTVNNFIHPLAAKILFCICDILMGYVLWEIIDS